MPPPLSWPSSWNTTGPTMYLRPIPPHIKTSPRVSSHNTLVWISLNCPPLSVLPMLMLYGPMKSFTSITMSENGSTLRSTATEIRAVETMTYWIGPNLSPYCSTWCFDLPDGWILQMIAHNMAALSPSCHPLSSSAEAAICAVVVWWRCCIL